MSCTLSGRQGNVTQYLLGGARGDDGDGANNRRWDCLVEHHEFHDEDCVNVRANVQASVVSQTVAHDPFSNAHLQLKSPTQEWEEPIGGAQPNKGLNGKVRGANL
jgi:hypothetical protein